MTSDPRKQMKNNTIGYRADHWDMHKWRDSDRIAKRLSLDKGDGDFAAMLLGWLRREEWTEESVGKGYRFFYWGGARLVLSETDGKLELLLWSSGQDGFEAIDDVIRDLERAMSHEAFGFQRWQRLPHEPLKSETGL